MPASRWFQRALAALTMFGALILTTASARAVMYDLLGTNPFGVTVSGTLEADAALTAITAVDVLVEGTPGPSGAFSFSSPVLQVNYAFAGHSFIYLYLSFAGGPTQSQNDQLILSVYEANVNSAMLTYDPLQCGGDTSCEAFLLAQRAGALAASFDVYNGSFSTVASVAAVPLPASLPLFAAALAAFGLLGWRRKRKAAMAA